MSEKFAEDVARRIRERAAELGVTQAAIVRKTGAAKSTVHGWFNGTTVPRGANAAKLRSILRCSQDWLMEGRGSPSAASEGDLFASLDASWDAVDNRVGTSMVRVPLLGLKGELDENDSIVVPISALSAVSDMRMAGWIRSSSRSAEDMIRQGDFVAVDSAVRDISESGAYYVISHVSGVNVHQVFAEVDGSWSILDASRGSKMTVEKDHQSNVLVLGRVVWRCGAVV